MTFLVSVVSITYGAGAAVRAFSAVVFIISWCLRMKMATYPAAVFRFALAKLVE